MKVRPHVITQDNRRGIEGYLKAEAALSDKSDENVVNVVNVANKQK